MEVIRISELPEKSSADVADIVPIVDVSGSGYVTKRTTIAGLVAQAIADWWNGSSAKEQLDGLETSVGDLETALDGKVSSSVVSVSAGKVLSVPNSMTLSSNDGASVNFGAGGSVLYSNSTIDGGQY